MKRLLYIMIVLFAFNQVNGQQVRRVKEASKMTAVTDTSDVDKTAGKMYVYDDKYWVGHGTGLRQMSTGVSASGVYVEIEDSTAANEAHYATFKALDDTADAHITKIEAKMTDLVDDTTPQLGGELDGQGEYLVDVQNIPDLAAKGAGLLFDGTDDDITVSDNDDIDWGTNDFSVLCSYYANTAPAGSDRFFSKRTGTDYWEVYADADSPYGLTLKAASSGGAASGCLINEVMPTGHNTFVISRGASTVNLYMNGILKDTGTSNAGSISNSADLKIGSYNTSSNWFDGSMSKIYLFNLALAAAEVKALQVAPIPYKYLGASQTLIVPSDDCADDDTANWTDVNGALTDNGTEYTYTVATGASVASFTDEAALVVGKRYRATVQAKDGTGAGSTVRIRALTNADVEIESGTGITVAAGFATASVEWTATETNNKVQIEIGAGTVGDGETVLFDEIECNSIGCTGQWESDAITSSIWFDKSGNNLNGTISGAIDINRAYPIYGMQHGADDDVGADDAYVLTLDPPAADYQTGMLVTLTVTTANTGTCSLNVNGLGVKTIKTVSGAAPANSDVVATGVAMLVYNGTDFILINPATTCD